MDPLPSPPDKRARQWAMALHFSQFAGFLVPFAGLLVPILIWQLKKKEMPSLDAHGKIVLNWFLSAAIYAGVFFLLSLVLIGIPLLYALGMVWIIFPIIGGIKAQAGEAWKYPLSISFLK